MAEAFSVPPSQIWEGNDGPWSTFALHIGTPGQQITVLPASSGSTIMATDVDYCDRWTDENLCSTLRGGILDVNSSGSFDRLWNGDQPFFELPFGPEAALGYESDGLVGLDFAGFGSTGGTDVLLPDQVVTTIASDFPWLGLLGLTARPSNITETVQRDSPLGSLVQQKTIPSSFWAYTAGAWYRKPPVYGSLTYGGYDAARGEMSNARAWKFWPNNARDLTVAVSQITVGSQSAALPGMPIYAYIDSVVPEIWLPLETCAAFEAAFGLQWNDTAVMYLVNESHHDTLVQQDASVTFVLGQSTSDPPSSGTRITLPYSAFELEALYPLAGITDLTTSVRYFPLKRASDETQYILGRTLLQEAYLAVDYDRSESSLTQVLFPDPPILSNIVTVRSSKHSGLSTGALAGISIGCIVAALLFIGPAAYFGRRRWKTRRNRLYRERIERDNAGLPTSQAPVHEYYAAGSGNELDSTTTTNRASIAKQPDAQVELESPDPDKHVSFGIPSRETYELESDVLSRRGSSYTQRNASSRYSRALSPTDTVGSERADASEQDGRYVARPELESPPGLHEMP